MYVTPIALEVPQPSEPATPAVPDAPVTPIDPDPGTPSDPEEPAVVPDPQEPPTPAVPEPEPDGPGAARSSAQAATRITCANPVALRKQVAAVSSGNSATK